MNNRTLLSKAAVDTSTLGTGGRMNAEQSTQFITFMKDYSTFLRSVDFITMQTTRRVLEYGDISRRNMRKAKENQDNAATGSFSTKQRELNAVGVIMPYDITFQFMKENIEKGNINTTLAQLFAQQFANDTIDLAFNGSESSTDDFLNINDGWVAIGEADAGTHKIDNAGITSKRALFKTLLGAVPSKYFQLYQQEDKSLLKLLVSHNVNREYKEELTERNTALGDSLLISGNHVAYDGFEIIPVGFLPDEVQMVTPLKNLAYGVYGGNIETYHDVVPRKTRHEYTLLADFDFEIHNPDVLVMGKKRT
ncbi:hypothetical protein [Lacrimispora sp.]|uniref:hypothetical protein n=1 Tax=Lacrimispora sp. TaxID=2719234 RepID=UPI0028ABFFFD|nr:hypothetical protein [Lacrimispora sp.]